MYLLLQQTLNFRLITELAYDGVPYAPLNYINSSKDSANETVPLIYSSYYWIP